MQLKLSILTFLFCVASLLNAQTNARPKLVVGIVVDQMSYDFCIAIGKIIAMVDLND